MLCIPPLQFRQGHLDKPVRGCATTVYIHDFGPDGVAFPLWQNVDPEDVVNPADNEPAPRSAFPLRGLESDRRKGDDLHGDSNDAVRRIPETHVPGVRTALWWPPRHYDDEYLDQDEEDDDDVPRPEVRVVLPHTLVAVSDDVQSHGHGEVEERLWVRLQTNNYLPVRSSHAAHKDGSTYQTGRRRRREEQRS